ncbi:MAG: biotin/lipoyl-containing protein [Actinomycetota bacterium]
MHDTATVSQAQESFAAPEATTMAERVVVAPCSGRFIPLPPETFTCEGEWVEPGQVVAEVRNGSGNIEVRSPFRGWVMGMLALSGQPVREGEALFWIRSS